MTEDLDKIATIETLQSVLVSAATGGEADNDRYKHLRRVVLAEDSLRGKLPRFVLDCRDLSQFWSYIRSTFKHYEERRLHIWEEFQPVLAELEGIDRLSSMKEVDGHETGRSHSVIAEQNRQSDNIDRSGCDTTGDTAVPDGRSGGLTFNGREESQPTVRSMANGDVAELHRAVFVVHGRNTKARDSLFAFLRSIGLHPLEWAEVVAATGKTSPYVGEVLDAALSQAQAIVVLLTPDDEARLRKPFRQPSDPPYEAALTAQARPNVLFEAGMAMGRSPDRTVLVELGSLRPFSDIGGRHTIRLDGTTQKRQELAQRLRLAGCRVNLDGTDWHTVGDFDLATRDVNCVV